MPGLLVRKEAEAPTLRTQKVGLDTHSWQHCSVAGRKNGNYYDKAKSSENG